MASTNPSEPTAAPADTPSWAAAFPAPRTTATILSREQALPLVSTSSLDLLIVDVRRTDYEGGAVAGSINLPAHSFYSNRGVLYDLCKRAGVKKVAFYCGSSNGRGPRCSGWFADYIASQNDSSMQSLTLGGGIKGWVKGGEEFTKHMSGYEPEYWRQFE